MLKIIVETRDTFSSLKIQYDFCKKYNRFEKIMGVLLIIDAM